MTQSLFWFALTEFVLSVSPGPAVFLVISQSMRWGYSAGFGAAIGIVSVNVAYFILSMIGVGAALAASPLLFLTLKYLGAAYLAWMAIGIMRDAVQARTAPVTIMAGSLPLRTNWRRSVPSGIAIQASSVKNLLVFIAIIPQFVDPSSPVGVQFMALCVVSVLVELPVLLGYAYLASSLASRIQNPSTRLSLDVSSAFVLMAIAVFVLVAAGET